MKRSTILMIAGLSVQVVNWVFSAVSSSLTGFSSDSIHSIKGDLGYASIAGWLVFFAGFGIRQLDKRKASLNEPRRRKR